MRTPVTGIFTPQGSSHGFLTLRGDAAPSAGMLCARVMQPKYLFHTYNGYIINDDSSGIELFYYYGEKLVPVVGNVAWRQATATAGKSCLDPSVSNENACNNRGCCMWNIFSLACGLATGVNATDDCAMIPLTRVSWGSYHLFHFDSLAVLSFALLCEALFLFHELSSDCGHTYQT